MADWHLAASLVALRTEINRRWPNRDKTSDGSIGDASHAARKSDHNPDWNAGGVVRAIDVDKDGINVQQLLDATIGDDRVAYVIWNRHIYSRTYGWREQDYTGSNPHDKHIHISIRHYTAAERDTSAWFNAAQPDTEEMSMADVQRVLDYQKACTIQIQDNTRQHANRVISEVGKLVQTYAVAVNDFTRQTDRGTDTERAAELDALQASFRAEVAKVLEALPTANDAEAPALPGESA